MANEKQKNKGKRSYTPLMMLVLYFINIVLIVVFQATVTHVHERPISRQSLETLPYFSNCQILDLLGEKDLRGPGYVLYRDSEGKHKLIQLDYMLFLNRFSINENSEREVPNLEDSEIEYRRLLAGAAIQISNGKINGYRGLGGSLGIDITFYAYTAIAMLVVEYGLIMILDKLKRRH